MMEKRMDAWLRRQVFAMNGEYGQCLKLQVKHLGVNNQIGSEVGEVSVSTDIAPDGITDLIAEIENLCMVDVEGLGGIQKYIIYPFFSDYQEGKKPFGRYIFRFTSAEEENEGLIDSEPANKAGLAAQAMRHQEACMKLSLGAIGNVINIQNRALARYSEQVESMQAKHIELIETLEELKGEKHERMLDNNAAEFKQRQTQEIVDRIMLLLPNVVNKLSGQKVLPEKTTPMEQMVRALFESFKPEQMPGIQKVFTPEQQIALAQIYEQCKKFEEVKENKGNGVNDVTSD